MENRDAGIPLAVAARERVHPFEIAMDATTLSLSLANTRISVNRLAGLRVANDRARAFRSEKGTFEVSAKAVLSNKTRTSKRLVIESAGIDQHEDK